MLLDTSHGHAEVFGLDHDPDSLRFQNIFDHFGATYEYADGVKNFHMSRQIANCSNANNDYIWGSKGTATINGWAPLHVIDGENPWRYKGPGNSMYQEEHNELIASIRAGKPMNDGSWMATSTMIAIMTRMAAYTGQTITWEQAMASKERLGPQTYSMEELSFAPIPVPGKTQFS